MIRPISRSFWSTLPINPVYGLACDMSRISPSASRTISMLTGSAGSNCAHVTARVDERTGWLLALCALDNLVKGAAGQAVQCANLATGLDEPTGLPLAGLYP